MKLSPRALELLQLEYSGPGSERKLEATRLVLREKCKQDLWFFCRYALEMEDIETDLHKDMCSRWQRRNKKRFTLWLVPRGHLKTSLWTEGGTLWDFINDPDQRHLIINAKLENANAIIANIRGYTRTKEIFRWLFPEYCLDLAPKARAKLCRDLTDRIDFPCSKYAGLREGNISAMGVEASLVSRHYDVLHFDDPVNDVNTNTKEYRDKVDSWYKNALQLRHSPKTSRVRLIGTRWHFDDLYSRRMREEMKRREEQIQHGKKVKPRYFIYTRKATEVVGKTRVPIWPERFTLSELDRLKGELGSYIYSCQYENDPVPEEDAIFKHTDIQVVDPLLIPDDVVNFAAIDMADEETTKGDFTVITVASFDPKGRMFVREIYRGKMFPMEIIHKLAYLQRKWNMQRVAIETTGFQKTIYKAQKREGIAMGLSIPWVEMNHARSSKRKRFLSLQPRVERKDFFVEAGIKNLEWLVEEMTTYDRAAHDDILDTLADIEAVYYAAPTLTQEQRSTDTYDALYGSIYETEDSMEGVSESAAILTGD